MEEDTTTTTQEKQTAQLEAYLIEQLVPLRDRIIKIETVINYHDKEFQNVKRSLSELAKTVDRHQAQILDKLEVYNKNYMDVLYSQYREQTDQHHEQLDKINANKNTFESYVARWKAVTWAVWFTICVTLATVGWGLSTAKDLGFFETHSLNEQTSYDFVVEDEVEIKIKEAE